MYNVKLYDKSGVFIQTLSEKEISCSYSFFGNINGGLGTLSFDYYGNLELKHKQRIKIYKSGNIIYQGFVVGITKKADKSGNKQIIKCSGLLGLLSYIPYPDGTVNGNPGTIIRNIVASSGLGFDTSNVLSYTEDISISADKDTHLSFLQKVLNQISDYGLYLTADNILYFTPYQTKHILTYNDDCYNIELNEDSTEYYNKITLKYSGGSVTNSNSSDIDIYGENYLVTEELEIKNSTTANLRIRSLLKEYDIVRNYKISVNSNIDYYSIKPGDLVSVRNTNRIIENKPVKQVQYSKNTAIIILDSYQSLEKFIINQK